MIVKYNKKIQKRLNLCFKDYKEYSQIYSSIEIELKIEDNKYNKFINISSYNEKYYHIYFDNSKEEIKRNYLKARNSDPRKSRFQKLKGGPLFRALFIFLYFRNFK